MVGHSPWHGPGISCLDILSSLCASGLKARVGPAFLEITVLFDLFACTLGLSVYVS